MSAPVQNTCPDIDKAIKLINAAIKSAKDGRKDFPDADDNFYYIISDLEDLEGMLEDLRRDNSKLRDWGYEMEAENEDLKKQIQELEFELPF